MKVEQPRPAKIEPVTQVEKTEVVYLDKYMALLKAQLKELQPNLNLDKYKNVDILEGMLDTAKSIKSQKANVTEPSEASGKPNSVVDYVKRSFEPRKNPIWDK